MPAYHQAMLVQYSQPKFAHSAAGTSSFAAGDTVGAGSHLHGEFNKRKREKRHLNLMNHSTGNKVQYQYSASEQQDNYDNSEDAHAIAEAYPEEPNQADSVIVTPQRQEEGFNDVVPPSELPPNDTPFAQTDFPIAAPDVYQPTPAPVAPPKTPKVHVVLDEDDEDDDNSGSFNPFGKQGGRAPPYSFFPVNFGRTSGGAIAVANAFSTGKGAARSHAIAYGSSANKRNAAKRANVE